MKISILTIFPEYVISCLDYSIIGKAINNNLVEVDVINIRDYALDKHKMTDDSPYGGGAGMIMKPEPIFNAFDDIEPDFHSILMTPQGKRLNQEKVISLSEHNHIVILCGHYEGIDQRVRDKLIDEEISIGDYVLTGGELPAIILVDAISRYIPGVLGNEESLIEESFVNDLLEYPHYTRPRSYRGMEVPEVLLSGNHQLIAKWRKEKSINKTKEVRKDLLEKNKNSEKR
ncbi:MAG: tRNA (guanosine(37)-N1)-methyltransferase TrmD [Clostridia bacterium]